jgi:hypothetical protein
VESGKKAVLGQCLTLISRRDRWVRWERKINANIIAGQAETTTRYSQRSLCNLRDIFYLIHRPLLPGLSCIR